MPMTDQRKAWIAVVAGIIFFVVVAAYSIYLSQEEVKGAERVGIWRTKKSDPAPVKRETQTAENPSRWGRDRRA